MRINRPEIEYWPNISNTQHIAKCARLCYASTKESESEKLLENLKKNGHFSMFRHGTMYFIIPFEKMPRIGYSEYICRIDVGNFVYLSVNLQWAMENPSIISELSPYEVYEYELKNTPGQDCIRRTFVVSTQISTSRELNRTSPNCIAEQSTRYVDFQKKGNIRISMPYWYSNLSMFKRFVTRVFWKIDEWAYNLFRYWGLEPQSAREFLPLCTETKVAYTYSLREWKHILDLRYWGITGKPHPNAKLIASEIRNSLIDQGFTEFTESSKIFDK